MPRNWSRAALAAAALALCAGPLPGAQGSWRRQAVDKLFECQTPEGWTVKPLSGEAAGFLLSDGLVRISAARHEGPKARFAGPQEYLRDAEALGRPLKKAGMAEVAGRNCARYERRGERRQRVKGRQSTEFLYEELVLRPDEKGFWALRLQSSSRTDLKTPRGLEEWKRFLATFQPLAPER